MSNLVSSSLLVVEESDDAPDPLSLFCYGKVIFLKVSKYNEEKDKVLKEFPFRVKYANKKAVDTGGVCLS